MFSNAKVGDRVWCFMSGWGTINRTNANNEYPIYVNLDKGTTEAYTKNGYRHKDDLSPTLFWNEITYEIPKKPLPKIKVNTPLWVWDSKIERGRVRLFSHFNIDGKVMVFPDGESSLNRDSDSGAIYYDDYLLMSEYLSSIEKP